MCTLHFTGPLIKFFFTQSIRCVLCLHLGCNFANSSRPYLMLVVAFSANIVRTVNSVKYPSGFIIYLWLYL